MKKVCINGLEYDMIAAYDLIDLWPELTRYMTYVSVINEGKKTVVLAHLFHYYMAKDGDFIF